MRQQIKQTALQMVDADGLINLTRSALCGRVDIPESSFQHVMGCTFTDFIAELKPQVASGVNHAVSKRRANPALRMEHILNAALEVAKENGFNKITKQSIAEAAGISVSLIGYYFKTVPQLKRAIMRAAISNGIVEIVAEGLAVKDPHARKAPKELKTRAAQLIANY